MKKLFLVFAAVFTLAMTANAQDHALGVRLGGGQGYNAELSWQHGLGGNRLELDLGWHNGEHYGAFDLTGIYQWTGEIGSGFGWYAGIGANLGYFDYEIGDSDVAIAIAGQGGIEYKFNAVPIQLSLDIRPRFYIIPDMEDHFRWGDIALGIRYCF